MKTVYKFLGVAVAVCLTAACAVAAEKIQAIEVGSEVPDFTLKDTAGKEHKLSDYKGKVVVLEFSSQHCPWSRGTDPHISELAKQYEGKEVVFLGIDSHASTPVEEIAKHVADNSISFPVLKDEQNEYADAVGAKQTPEMYVVDKEGKLAYQGAYDNRKNPDEKGDTNYVSAAVDALLEGKEVEVKQEKAWGCGIKRVG